MEIKLEKSIIDGLSSRGVLAYVAVKMAEGAKATTAVLAQSVGAQSGSMKEGLDELSLAAPGLVMREGNKWVCGQPREDGEGQVLTMTASRYQTFMDDLKKYWDFMTTPGGGSPSPFEPSKADCFQIQRFLKDHGGWSREMWLTAFRNRAISIIEFSHASRTEPFCQWIPKLAKYEKDVLDRFDKPAQRGERHGKVHDIQQGNRAAGSEFLNRVRARAQGGTDREVRDDVRAGGEPHRHNGTA